MIASDWLSTTEPSANTGTSACGFNARNSALNCSPPPRLRWTGTYSASIPLRFSAMRTRYEAELRKYVWRAGFTSDAQVLMHDIRLPTQRLRVALPDDAALLDHIVPVGQSQQVAHILVD